MSDHTNSEQECFVIMDAEPSSDVSLVANDEMGEPETSFQEVTQILSSACFEQSVKTVAESSEDSGPIYENIANIEKIAANSKDVKMTQLPITENPRKEAYIGLSQPLSAEVQQKNQKKKPPPLLPKPSIRKHKQELNKSEIQSLFVTGDREPIKTNKQKLQQQEQQQKFQHQQKQQRLHVIEGEVSGQAKHEEPNRKQEEQETQEKKEIEDAKDEQDQPIPKPRHRAMTLEAPKASTYRNKNEDATAKRGKEEKDITSSEQYASIKSKNIIRQCQDDVGSNPPPAVEKEEQKHGKGAKHSQTKSEQVASKPGYTMVIGLSESTSYDNLWNFMEGKSDADLREIVYGSGRENAVVISDSKPGTMSDHTNSEQECFVIMDAEPSSDVSLVANNEMGEPETSFREVTQILSSVCFEQSVKTVAESSEDSGPIYENIANIEKIAANSKDVKMTQLPITENPRKEAYIGLSQPLSAEVQQKILKKKPPPLLPKPSIRKHKQELNKSEIQSLFVTGDRDPKKTDKYLLEVGKEAGSVEQFMYEESQKRKSIVPVTPLELCETHKYDHSESRFPNEMGLILPSLPPKSSVIITEPVRSENIEEDLLGDSRPQKSIAVMEALKHVRMEGEMLESSEITHPPTLQPKKMYKPEVQPSQLTKRSSDKSASKRPHSMQFSPSGQQRQHLQNQQEGPSLPTWHQHKHLSGSQGAPGHRKPHGYDDDVQMPSTSDGHQNWAHGAYQHLQWSAGRDGKATRQPGLHEQPPKGLQQLEQPQMRHAQYWSHSMPIYPGYGHEVLPDKQGDLSRMIAGGSLPKPSHFASKETQSGETYKTTENQNQHYHQQEQQQQEQQQQKLKHQQKQQRLHVIEGEVSGQAKHEEPNRKQEEQEMQEKKEIEDSKDKQDQPIPKPRHRAMTLEAPKASTYRNKNEDATAKKGKEEKDITSSEQYASIKSKNIIRQCQDDVGSNPPPAVEKEEQKHGKGAKHSQTKSEQVASKPGYTMVIGLSESTSYDNLWNFMEGKSDADLREIVYGSGRENAVVISDSKPDHENLQNKVSKKTLHGKFLEVFDVPPPTSIIVSSEDPKEFSTDTLTFHFESKKYGGAELVEDGIKITEDGCYIMTFTDSDAVERVCAIQHKIENILLNVSPYYQFKKWTAWNTAIHGINIPEPFVHQVDPELLRYMQSFPRAIKAVRMAMVKMHAGIELQEDALLVTCLLNPEVKGCRKLVASWRKDAEEHCNTFLSVTFQIGKISSLSDIWDDFIDFVKSIIKGKEIMLVEERFKDYIQLIGFHDKVKTTHEEIMETKKKLERIRRVGIEILPLQSAAKKCLLDRVGIFQRLRAQFSDFDVHFEQSCEEIVLRGVPEDRNSVKLQIYEELRKFDEPVIIQDSSEHFSQFIKEGVPRNYIIKEMETNGLMVDWEVSTENGHVFVYCIPVHSTEHAAIQMKKMVRETNIPLSQAEQLFVTTEEWMMYQAEVRSKCDGLVHIVVTNDLKNVIWISMEGLHGEILEELKDFIKKNTVVEEMIQLNPITKKFMQTFWEPEDYKKIYMNGDDKHLQITLQGNAERIQRVKERISKIINKSYTLQLVGIKELVRSEKEMGILMEALKMEHHCIIQIESSDLPSHEEIKRDVEMDKVERVYDTVNESMIVEKPRSIPYRCQNGLTIALTKGQLAQEKVDVIVCATTPDLKLNIGAVCKSLLQQGGQGLQEECNAKYAELIQEGEVVDIDGGNLHCDKVYLTVLPHWKRSNNGQTLRDVVIKCLEKAHDDSKRSIAFAAMGTGQLHYPHFDVARLMYDACIAYDSKNPQSSVKKVHFVLCEKDNDSVRAFEKEEKNMLCGGARPRSSLPAPQEHLVGNVKISQTVEELANQQVDAILCSCAENLVLSQSGACAALLHVGGQSLQDECKIKYPNGIRHGQIAKIGGGNLKCKHVFLTALPQYAGNGEKVLFDVIIAALKLAAKKGCKSIAMTAMGSGYLKYPANVVAKVMYDAVGDWAKKNTTSSLTTVKFVLFFKDKSTQDAFQDQATRVNIRQQRPVSIHDVKTLQKDNSCIIIDPNDDSVCTVGKMKVKVYTGDIIKETTDAIVNSVGADFLFQGGVSLLLKQKCPRLEKKCQDKVAKLHQSGVVMTDSFGLKCKKIIHVKFQDTLTGWKRVMKKCLEKASKIKLSSITFPVLGTGDGYTSFAAVEIAEMFFEALISFDDENKKHQLQHVNVIVYHNQPQFIPAIKKGMKKFSHKGKTETTSRILDRLKDARFDMTDTVMPRSELAEKRNAPVLSCNQMSQIIIKVCSDSECNIDQCITSLKKKLEMAYTCLPLIDDLIAKMSLQELEEFFKTELLVECEFVQEKKQVLIRGTKQNVSKAQNEFHQKLRDKARKESVKEEAEQLFQIVQWHYEEVTWDEMKLTPFDKLINLRMEEAFKNDDQHLHLPDSSKNIIYIIDFKNYLLYVKGDEEDSVKIVRKDILKARLDAVPMTWSTMQDKENLKRVNVLNLSPEYQQLESIFLKEAKTGPYSNRVPNVQNIKVVKIERIQNKTLYQQYSAKKKFMETRYKDNPNVTIEQKVWHATVSDSIDGICSHGFNRSYCGKNGVWYGHGVYFATNASYSTRAWLTGRNQMPQHGTEKYIFYVSVCVGEYIQGNQNMRVLPAKNDSNPTDIYDSAVNDVNNVEEIVIFNDTQAYPNYLITFTT